MMKVPQKDVQMLSEYLDGQLAAADRQKLELRLRSNADLRETYDDLRRLRGMLRSLPQRKVPHNFTLTRAMAAEARRVSRWFPFFRASSALAALAAVVLVVFQLLPASGAGLSAAPASFQAPAAIQAPAVPRAALPNAAASNSAGEVTPTALIFQWGANGMGGAEGSGLPGALAAKAIPPGYGIGGGPSFPTPTEVVPGILSGAEPLLQPTPPPYIMSAPQEATPAPTTGAEINPAAPAAPPSGAESTGTAEMTPTEPVPTEAAALAPQAPAGAESTGTAEMTPTESVPTEAAVLAPQAPAEGAGTMAAPSDTQATAFPAPSAALSNSAQDHSNQLILGLPSKQDQGKITLPETPVSPTEGNVTQSDTYRAAASASPEGAALPLKGILAGVLALVALGAGLAAYFIRRR